MPVRSTPAPGTPPTTKRITPDELDPAAEWLEIIDYLDVGVLRAARAAGIKTITQGSKVREEQDDDAYLLALFTSQLKGYRLEALPDDVTRDQALPEAERQFQQDADGVWRWQFKPANFLRLPLDLRNWLHLQILDCGGIVPTANVVVKTASGQVLDFRGQSGVVDGQQESEVPDTERNATVQ